MVCLSYLTLGQCSVFSSPSWLINKWIRCKSNSEVSSVRSNGVFRNCMPAISEILSRFTSKECPINSLRWQQSVSDGGAIKSFHKIAARFCIESSKPQLHLLSFIYRDGIGAIELVSIMALAVILVRKSRRTDLELRPRILLG